MDLRRLTHAAGRLIGAGLMAALIVASCDTAAGANGGQNQVAGPERSSRPLPMAPPSMHSLTRSSLRSPPQSLYRRLTPSAI